jgi:hypothetical protein
MAQAAYCSAPLNVFPNPVISGTGSASFTLEKSADVVLNLHDITGKIIRRQTAEGSKGENAVLFDFKNVAAGLYILRIETELQSVNMKVVVK